MLEIAWNAAREWAAEARRQEASARRQAQSTLGLAALAAMLAAIAAAVGAPSLSADASAPAASLPLRWTSILSLLAGFIAAAAALFGRYVQQGSAKLLTDAQLVEQGETLMAGEHAAWTQRMLGSSDKG